MIKAAHFRTRWHDETAKQRYEELVKQIQALHEAHRTIVKPLLDEASKLHAAHTSPILILHEPPGERSNG